FLGLTFEDDLLGGNRSRRGGLGDGARGEQPLLVLAARGGRLAAALGLRGGRRRRCGVLRRRFIGLGGRRIRFVRGGVAIGGCAPFATFGGAICGVLVHLVAV